MLNSEINKLIVSCIGVEYGWGGGARALTEKRSVG